MKTNRVLPSMIIALACCLQVPLVGDDDTSSDDSSIMVDPGAPPAAFAQKPIPTLSPAERAQVSQRQSKALADRNWLLRGYAAELAKKKDGQDPEDTEADTFRRADLNQASGLSMSSSDEMGRLLDVQYAQDTRKLAPPNPSIKPQADGAKNSTTLFKPFLSMERSKVLQPFAAPSPVFSPLTGPLTLDSGADPDETTPKLSARIRSGTMDPAAMDIPGMTAMENNPATREENELADSDLLPGERRSEERPHHALQLELPTARTADRVQKMQDDALSVPGIPGQLPKKTAVGAKAPTILPPINDREQMVPHPSPLRTHMEDPYDILH